MKLGINLFLWIDVLDDGMDSVLKLIQRFGYDGVEMPIIDLDIARWERWSARLDDLGLARTAVAAPAPDCNPVSDDPRVRDAAADYLRRAIDCAVALGSTVLCGPLQVAPGVFTGAGATSEEWKRSVDHLRSASAYAKDAGVVLAVEVVNRFESYHLNTLEQGSRFVDEVGHPNCRIHLDTFHAHIEEKNTADAIRAAGDRIAHVHVNENDRGVPGTGAVAWNEIFQALHEIGYGGWLTVQACNNSGSRVAAGTKSWRPLLESEERLVVDAHAFLEPRARGAVA